MQKQAFKLKLNSGQEAEYKRRHDTLWPELEQLLKETGIENYSIFLDEGTLDLFGVLDIENPEKMDDLPNHPIMKKYGKKLKRVDGCNQAGRHLQCRPQIKRIFNPLKQQNNAKKSFQTKTQPRPRSRIQAAA
jgi:L-rhamnose mutarotase